ncbi:type IV secretion system protein [Salmonella enterica]|nr:type IV secretion system protein [Salmonella enterica]
MPDQTTNFFSKIDSTIMASLKDSVAGKMAEYSAMMGTIIGITISLYVLWCGYLVFAGKLQRPIESIIWDLAKMGVILAFVMNAGGYLDLAVSAIDGLKSGLSGHDNIWAALDKLWVKAQKITSTLMELDDDYVPLTGAIGSILALLGTVVALGVSFIVFFIAEVTLLILTTTAPVFIFCMMYGFLRTMFNNWLQAIFASLITVMLGGLIFTSGISYYGDIIDIVQKSTKSNIEIMGTMACVAGIIIGLVVFKASSIAHQLAGVSAQGALEGIAMGAAAVGLFGAAKALSGMAKGGIKQGKGFVEGVKGAEKTPASGGAGYAAGNIARNVPSKARAALEKARAAGWARASGEQEKPRSIVPDKPKPITGIQWRSAPTVNSTPKIKD